MGNKVAGSGSKSTVLCANDSAEIKRALVTFKNLAGTADVITRDQFAQDVFGGFMPLSFSNRLYELFGGSKKGIAPKDMLDGLSVFLTDNEYNKAKFVFRFYAGDANVEIIHKEDFLAKLRVDQDIPSSVSVLFGNDTIRSVDCDAFCSWLQQYPDSINLYSLLNQGLSLTAVPEKHIPSFHQVLAGITHFSEENIASLERTYWNLISSSSSHQFDQTVFVRVVSPPLSPDVAQFLFSAFDDRKDGSLDLRELAAGLSACCYGPMVERTKFTFRLFDNDNDGLLNSEEIDAMLTALLKAHVLLDDGSSNSNCGSVIFLLSDITNLRKNIIQTFATTSSEGKCEFVGLNLEQFLQWTLNCSLHQPFLELLFQVCHVGFGIRPSDRKTEGAIIRSYFERCDATELIPGDFVYLIPSSWWLLWCSWVGLEMKANLSKSHSSLKLGNKDKAQASSANPPPRQQAFKSSKDFYQVPSTGDEAGSKGDTIGSSVRLVNGHSAKGSFDSPNQPPLSNGSVPSQNPDLKNRPVLRVGRFANAIEKPIASKHQVAPGPIDTTTLAAANTPAPTEQNKICLTNDTYRPLRLALAPYRPGFGFEILPQSIWMAFQAWYGCKPNTYPVIRRVVHNSATALPEIEYQPVRITFVRQSNPSATAASADATALGSPASTAASVSFGIGTAAASLMRSVFGSSNTNSNSHSGLNSSVQSAASIPTLSAAVSSNEKVSQNGNSIGSSSLKYYDAAYGYFSRCTPLGDVIKSFARFHLNPDCIRLWVVKNNGSVTASSRKMLIWSPGKSDTVTLGQACSLPALECIDSSMVELRILIEVANIDQTWPEDVNIEAVNVSNNSISDRDSPISSDMTGSQSSTVGLIGFQNLGNTCFLNAILQCLSNTTPLNRYFLRSLHLSELNMTNPLGFHGLVALRYAELMRMVWTSSASSSNLATTTQKPLSPAKIKNVITKTWRQLGDSDQQDAQELMTFLLDGLHEDLNRKRRVLPQSQQQATVETEEKAENDTDDKKEESSNNESANASNNSNDDNDDKTKTVQTAWNTYQQANDSVIIDLFHGLLSFEITCSQCRNASTTYDPFSYVVLPLPADRKITIEMTVIFLEASNFPVRIGVRVKVGALCQDIYDQVEKVLFGQQQSVSEGQKVEDRFILAEVSGSSIVRFFDVKDSLAQVSGIVSGELVLFEAAPKLSNQTTANGSVKSQSHHHCHPGGTGASQCDKESCKQRFALYDRMGLPQRWRDHFLIVVNRQLVTVPNYVLPQLNWRPVLFGRPFIVPFETTDSVAGEVSTDGLYLEVWERTRRYLSSKKDPKLAVVPNSSGGNYARDGDFPPDSDKTYPFELTRVAGPQCQRCSMCPWYSFCRGCSLSTTSLSEGHGDAKNGKESAVSGFFLGVNWDPRTLYLYFNHYVESSVQISDSIEHCRRKAVEPLSLYDCLATFSQREPVDGYVCEQKTCPSKQQLTMSPSTSSSDNQPVAAAAAAASSHMCLARLPPVMIVYLKRFFMARDGRWMKSSRKINVPIDNLDLADYMAASASEDGSQRYRLYAAVCHYGAMRSGHYVTYAKHQPSGIWYFFDDTSVKEVLPSEIDMSAVYLLFYERIGVDYDSLLPSIDDLAAPMDPKDALKAAEEAEQSRLNRNRTQNGAQSTSRCSIQ